MSYLSVESRDRITFVPAKYPLFENVTDRKLRALMCLFLGCDVYGGMNGVGAKTLAVDIIQAVMNHIRCGVQRMKKYHSTLT